MPDPLPLFAPSGLLRPSFNLPALPSFGGTPTDISAYMPQLPQIVRAYQDQEAQKPWCVEPLEFFDELLFGQMVKGFLAGTGETGAGDNLWEGFRKNPIFQVIDMLLPGQPFTGRDVRFTDVRESLGWSFGQKNVNEGVANFFINLAGEIILDPSSFWNPYGKISGTAIGLRRGGQAAARAAKPMLQWDQMFKEIAKAEGHTADATMRFLKLDMGALVKQTETARRALFVWNIPIIGQQYVWQPFKAMDINIAKALEGVAEFLNTNPVTRPVLAATQKMAVGIKGAATRAFVRDAITEGGVGARIQNQAYWERVMAIQHDHPDILRNPDGARGVMLSMEWGLNERELDDLGALSEIFTNESREVRQAQSRFERLTKESPEFAQLVEQARTSADPLIGQQAAFRLYDEFPNVAIPKDIREAWNLPARAGLELKRPIPVAVQERNILDVMQPPGVPETLPSAAPLGPTPGQEARAGLEGEVAGMSAAQIEAAQAEHIGVFQRIHAAGKQQDVAAVTAEFQSILKGMWDSEHLAGFINSFTELYFPRIVNPEVRKGIEEKLLSSVEHGFNKQARAYVAAFMKKRGGFDQLDTYTVNSIAWELGTKYTEWKPIKDAFRRDPVEGIHRVLARWFDPVRADVERLAPEALHMFDTQPFSAVWRRLEDSTKTFDSNLINKNLLDPNGPIALARTRGSAYYETVSNLTQREGHPVVALAMKERGTTATTFRTPEPATLLDLSTRNNQKARFWLAKDQLEEQAHQLLGEGKREFGDLLDEWDGALGLTHKGDLAVKDTDTWAVAAMKRHLQAQKDWWARAQREKGAVRQLSALIHGKPGTQLDAEDLDAFLGLWEAAAIERVPESSALTAIKSQSVPGPTTAVGGTESSMDLAAAVLARKRWVEEARRSLEWEISLFGPHSQRTKDAAARLRLEEEGLARMEAVGGLATEGTVITPVTPAPQAAVPSRKVVAPRGWESFRQYARWLRNDDLEALRHSKLRIQELKDVIRAQQGEIRGMRDEYLAGIKAGSKDKQQMLREIVGRKLSPEQTREALILHRWQHRDGVLPLTELQQTDPALFEKIIKNDPELVYVRKDHYDAIWGPNGTLSNMRRPDKLGENWLIKHWDQNTSWWKAWTLMPAVFLQRWMRDWMTNEVMQIAEGGFNAVQLGSGFKDSYKFSHAIQRALNGDYSLLPTTSTRRASDGMELTARQVFDKLQPRGLVGSPLVRDEMFLGTQEALRLQGVAPSEGGFKHWLAGILPPIMGGNKFGKATDNALIQGGYKMAVFGDNHSKLSGFLGRWHGGMDIDEAVQRTAAVAYDPMRTLTTFERHTLRRLIPFYAWQKFAISTTLKQYFTKPGVVTWWNKMHESLTKAQGLDPANIETILPEFLQDNLGIPVLNSPEGPKYMVLGNYLPLGEVTRITQALQDTVSGDPKEGNIFTYWMERFDPFAKQAIEQVFNKNFYTQGQLVNIPGEHDEMFGITMPKRVTHAVRALVRGFNELDRLNIVSFQDFKELRVALGNAVPRGQALGSRKELPWWERLISGAFGVTPRAYLVDVQEQTRHKKQQQEFELNRLKGLLRKRVEDDGKPAKQADIGTIQELIAEQLAKQARREQVERDYRVPLLRR